MSALLPGFVPYIATEWDDGKLSWAALDSSPTANAGRYNHDPIMNKVPRDGGRVRVKRVKPRRKEKEIAIDAVDLAMPLPEAVDAVVARLPAERYDVKTLREKYDSEENEIVPNEVQWELIALLQPLSIELAYYRVNRSHIDRDDAVSTAALYLRLAVLAGPVGRTDKHGAPLTPIEFVTNVIRNALRQLAKDKQKENNTFDGMTSDGEVVKRVRDKTPVDPDDPVAVETARAKEDAEHQKLLGRIRSKYTKQWDRHNIGLGEYDTMKSKCLGPLERNVLLLALTGASVNRIVIDLRIKRREVHEILIRLAA